MNKDEIISKAIETPAHALSFFVKRVVEIVLLRKIIVIHEKRYQHMEEAYYNYTLVNFRAGYAKKTFGI
jgi:hypothetical protein